MPTVTVNPPKTPVTEGSGAVAAATIPNVCKMPGAPAPFVPAPLPNVGRSALSPTDFSTSVRIKGHRVAVGSASFKSIGDVASRATGGGLISSNVEGPTKFIAPGSMDVRIEGQSVHLLGDQMLNNCGPSGSPANAATAAGVIQAPGGGSLSPAQCPGHELGEPRYPETEEEFKDRRNAMARDPSPGGVHEHAAAKHNEPDILRLEGSLRRENPDGPTRSALSGRGTSEKIVHICRRCGAVRPGEIDHAVEERDGKRHAVEAKSGENFFPAQSPDESRRNRKQMQSLAEMSANTGMGVTYKIPQGHDKAARQIESMGRELGIIPRVIRI